MPSHQWSALVVPGDVMEIAKLMVLLSCITLTACGLYRNRCRPSATQSQASSSPNSSSPPPPPSTKPVGKAPPLPSLFPVPCRLVQFYSSFCVMLSMVNPIQNPCVYSKFFQKFPPQKSHCRGSAAPKTISHFDKTSHRRKKAGRNRRRDHVANVLELLSPRLQLYFAEWSQDNPLSCIRDPSNFLL
jgi:hypothetical protein